MNLDLKRKKLELARVSLAREEQEFKIAEYHEQIRRLTETVEIQVKKEIELKQEISKLETKGE